jgi:serine/threonine protein kinase
MDINQEQSVLDDKYLLHKKIGKGATCKVHLGRKKNESKELAIKILTGNSKTSNNSKHYTAEIEMLKKISHPNIINLLDGNKGILKKHDGRSKLVDYIVLEYASNGELFDYIYFPRQGFGEKLARGIFTQIINGLNGCHLSGVAHRDLKTENIMMTNEWRVKLADFGYATLLAGRNGNGLLTTSLGTPGYAAPEILNRKPYLGSAADIFSCGVILFVLVTGKLPFGKAMVHDQYYKNFVRNDYDTYWTIMSPRLDNVSNEFKSLINSLLAYDPVQRPSIDEIMNHPWMTGEQPKMEEYLEEFERRKCIVTKMREIEAAEEARKKKMTRGVYRGDGDDIQPDVFNEDVTIGDYIEGTNPYKVKITGSNYVNHLNFLHNYFDKKDQKAKTIDVKDDLAKFKVIYELDRETQETLSEFEIEKLALEVELKKIDDENYVAEFSKISGTKLDFYNIYDEFLSYSEKK